MTRTNPKIVPDPIPCANCARPVVPNHMRTYCSDLCSQVAGWIRYFQKIRSDGRWHRYDIQEALGVKLAHIAAGGYDNRGRTLPVDVRRAVFERDGGNCRKCGRPGTEIDHISGSSADLSNLQLLCHECHMMKTQSVMVRAEPELIATVHHPIHERALEIEKRQPCDEVTWNHRWWVAGGKDASDDLRAKWSLWTQSQVLELLTPPMAVKGFPLELDPWSWYQEDEIEPPTPVDLEAETRFKAARSEYLREWAAERRAKVKARRERPITIALPFYPTFDKEGKWHLSMADTPDIIAPNWSENRGETPACISYADLNLKRKPITPKVGDKVDRYLEKLCGRCLGMVRKPVKQSRNTRS